MGNIHRTLSWKYNKIFISLYSVMVINVIIALLLQITQVCVYVSHWMNEMHNTITCAYVLYWLLIDTILCTSCYSGGVRTIIIKYLIRWWSAVQNPLRFVSRITHLMHNPHRDDNWLPDVFNNNIIYYTQWKYMYIVYIWISALITWTPALP